MMIGVALAGGLIHRAGDDAADQRGGDLDARDPRAGEARGPHQLAAGLVELPEWLLEGEASRVIIVGYGRVGALIGTCWIGTESR